MWKPTGNRANQGQNRSEQNRHDIPSLSFQADTNRVSVNKITTTLDQRHDASAAATPAIDAMSTTYQATNSPSKQA